MNSRSKGNRGELKAAKLVEKWTGKKFARVPSSGGLQWKNSNAKGDIVCTEEGHYFPLCLEIKNYKDINFEHLFYIPKPKILEFWNQAQRDAKIANKCPMLMMRYDRLPNEFWFVIMPKAIFFKYFHPYLDDDEDMVFSIRKLDIVVFSTPSLLKIPYKKIRKPLKAHFRP